VNTSPKGRAVGEFGTRDLAELETWLRERQS
jgi:hypothetical protein